MSYRDNHRGSGRRDGRRSELRLLEDEPQTDRYDWPALWSRGHGDEPRGRSSRARDRAYGWTQPPSDAWAAFLGLAEMLV